MEFDYELTKFHIFKKPIENHALSSIDTANFALQVPPTSEAAIKAEQRKKTSFHKSNFKVKPNGGGNLTTKKNFKERLKYQHKSNSEGTSYYST